MTACQPPADGRPLVAFDFDGTLTIRDSFNAFLVWRRGPLRFVLTALKLIPAAAVYGMRRDRSHFKSAMVRTYLGGVAFDAVRQEARQFAKARLSVLIRPDALECWRKWQAQGACLVIVTASPDFVVAPFAEWLGADHLIGTRLVIDADGRLTGALNGQNCRGPEKVARLKVKFGPEVEIEAAYGDTSGDREMIAAARERGYRVFRARP